MAPEADFHALIASYRSALAKAGRDRRMCGFRAPGALVVEWVGAWERERVYREIIEDLELMVRLDG